MTPRDATPGKPETRPATRGPGNSRGPLPDPERATRMVAALAAGPLTSKELAARLGCTSVTAQRLGLSRPDLFRKRSERGPWDLTPEGRAALTPG